MPDANIYVSNGTCYTAAGKELDKSFIPCGNDAFGRQTCCGAGDNCLADKACFGVHGSGYGSDLTYFAGCTDPDYRDASCPDKKDIDQPWIALTLCDNSDGVWAACSQKGDPSTLQPGSYCTCTDAAAATVAFKDNTVLANIASLPRSLGNSISFADGHAPTSPAGVPAGSSTGSGSGASQTGPPNNAPTQSTTGAGNTGGSVTRTVSTTAPPSNTAGGQLNSSPMATGAKIGIGVGVAIGVIVVLVVLGMLLLRRRRRHSNSDHRNSLSETVPPDTNRISDVSTTATKGVAAKEADRPASKADRESLPELDGNALVEADGHTAQPWALGSELEGTEMRPQRTELPLSPVPELPGSVLLGEGHPEDDTEWRIR